MRLFDRKVEIAVRNLDTDVEFVISRLQVEFQVERTLELEPNTLVASVYNLSEDTRHKLEDDSPKLITLTAGYGEDLHIIFRGRQSRGGARSRREGPNIVTEIEAGDGKNLDRIWARKNFPKGASLDSVMNYLISLTGLGPGNLSEVLDQVEDNGLPRTLQQGLRVRGYGIDQLWQLANSRGLEFSVQNDECQFLLYGEGVQGIPRPLVSSSSGLDGTPTVDNEGILAASFRLIPNVYPGTLLDVKSEFVEGTFRCLTGSYTGSVWGQDFSLSIEAKRQQ